MYDKVSPNLNFVEREKKTEKFWEENHIFQKSIDERKEGEVYTFYDGPPTANGKPHIGHVLTRVIKDMIPRYRTMKGYKVLRKAGILTDFRLNLKLKRNLVLTARNKSKNTVLNRSSSNVRKVYGSIKVCGKISQVQSAFGLIWTILM